MNDYSMPKRLADDIEIELDNEVCNMKNHETFILYNDEGETVFSSSNYKEIAAFLDRSMSNTYSTIFRIRNSVISHVYDRNGNKYIAEIVTEVPRESNAVINEALDFLYENGTFDEDSEYGPVFIKLADILEENLELERDGK